MDYHAFQTLATFKRSAFNFLHARWNNYLLETAFPEAFCSNDRQLTVLLKQHVTQTPTATERPLTQLSNRARNGNSLHRTALEPALADNRHAIWQLQFPYVPELFSLLENLESITKNPETLGRTPEAQISDRACPCS